MLNFIIGRQIMKAFFILQFYLPIV